MDLGPGSLLYMEKTASKNIIASGSYGIIQLLYTANFKSRYLKTTLGTLFEKTIQAEGLKLGSYVPLMSFYKLISGIFEKIFMAENEP